MLAELEALDLVLHQMAQSRHSYPFLKHSPRLDVIERTPDYVGVLSPETVRALLTLNIVVADERKKIADVDRVYGELTAGGFIVGGEGEARHMKAVEAHERTIEGKAIALLERTAQVRERLTSDGALRLNVPVLLEPDPRRLTSG